MRSEFCRIRYLKISIQRAKSGFFCFDSDQVRRELRLPVLTTGGISSFSIMAICLAKVDSAKISPRLGPVWVNIRVTSTFCP